MGSGLAARGPTALWPWLPCRAWDIALPCCDAGCQGNAVHEPRNSSMSRTQRYDRAQFFIRHGIVILCYVKIPSRSISDLCWHLCDKGTIVFIFFIMDMESSYNVICYSSLQWQWQWQCQFIRCKWKFSFSHYGNYSRKPYEKSFTYNWPSPM
jgi:hypothetical protein